MPQCVGKKPFATAADAAAALELIRGNSVPGHGVKVPVAYYSCDVCGKWHLTSAKYFDPRQREKPKARRLGRRHRKSV